ncbi:MAG TPA: NAD(P)H-dependent oxidoreductase subunit E, partial [Terriglobales bacterium]|nr:NAD(P)H-dependent oxidoreductase subunit E [Terriglobales bacterium]
FEQRFAEMLKHYPVKRSVLVPSLLYAQDEVGYLSDEVIAELAKRCDLTELEVRNVISYYSMLTTKPRGKYNVQVCTNICCMLRGADDIYGYVSKTLGIGHKGTTADGVFSLESVECIGACSWAPAMQVNYDFHENLTPEKIDRILEEYARKEEVGK